LRLGILAEIVEPREADAVARDLGLDPRAVEAVLEALAAQGVLERSGGYLLREEHRGPLLEIEHPEYAGAFVQDRSDQIAAWSRLPEMVRGGGPVEDRTTSSGGVASGVTANFIHRMRREALPGAEVTSQMLLPRIPEVTGGASVLDVGGGPGATAEALSRRGARVTVFDLPEVISLVRERLEQYGISCESGDVNDSLPDGPFDAVYLGHVSHMYGPGENRTLFRKLHDALAPGGLLAVRDFVRGKSRGAELFAVNMLVFTPNGCTYTAEEYEIWMREAGFETFEVAQVPGRDTHLVLARASGAG
jgi:2-polyprenyl-3-methyl-5-hydroxy-6-metoxy-1,4-benzoquinol methylase